MWASSFNSMTPPTQAAARESLEASLTGAVRATAMGNGPLRSGKHDLYEHKL